MIEWHKAHAKLEAKHLALIAERNALPDPEPMVEEAIAYEGMTGLIASWQFAEANLLRQLEGKSGKAFVSPGGVISGVA